jgi:hypothetical protein
MITSIVKKGHAQRSLPILSRPRPAVKAAGTETGKDEL